MADGLSGQIGGQDLAAHIDQAIYAAVAFGNKAALICSHRKQIAANGYDKQE